VRRFLNSLVKSERQLKKAKEDGTAPKVFNQRFACHHPFTSGEESVEVFGKVVMRGSCGVSGLERL
jgi:hypothetical protein